MSCTCQARQVTRKAPAQPVPALPERDSRLKCRLHSVPQNVVRIEGRTVRRSEDWPGYRVMVAVAAFTGLSCSEIRGLTWEAWQGDELHVLRSIVAGHVQDTKTRARKTPAPLLPSLCASPSAVSSSRREPGSNGDLNSAASSISSLRMNPSSHTDLQSKAAEGAVLGPVETS